MAKETVAKDVVIIGAGMAGLTAALYAGRSNLSTLVLENELVGGRLPMPQALRITRAS